MALNLLKTTKGKDEEIVPEVKEYAKLRKNLLRYMTAEEVDKYIADQLEKEIKGSKKRK